MNFYAHTAEDKYGKPLLETSGKWQPLSAHLRRVAESAGVFAEPFGMSPEAETAGLLHDLGKYSDRFQERLRNPSIHGINHWASGTLAARELGYRLVPFAVDGHHTGIPSLKRDDPVRSLRNTLGSGSDPKAHQVITGFSETCDDLLDRFEADGLQACKAHHAAKEKRFDEAFRIRMLFSCLVDADFLDTEKHFDSAVAASRSTLPLQPSAALDVLLTELHKKPSDSEVNRLRCELLADCLAAAENARGLFTLTAPTGSGKTLSALAFALKHAATHDLRRVIVVIPYTSIIEQTAKVYRDTFSRAFGDGYVLEHHSAVASRESDSDEAGDAEEARLRRARLAAENWEAPLVVTTSVQFFESLFSNRTSKCRKLHNIARSVVVFDEVQTLPIKLVPSLLSGVNLLVRNFGVTAVFCTATQPAFRHAAKAIQGGWVPVEISSQPRAMAEAFKRTKIIRRPDDQRPSWRELADELDRLPQVLCIVNARADARNLFEALSGDGRFHLSAAMCAAHRQDKIAEIRRRLSAKQTCRLISTQLIEAGVDVDFPAVYRAMGPLDSIIQSAGRCNREGKIPDPAPVIVFRPAEGGMPRGAYRQAAAVTQSFLHEHPNAELHLPKTYEEYFQRLYGTLGPNASAEDPVFAHSEEYDFPAAATACKLVDETRALLVPYGEGMELIETIKRQNHIDAALARRSQRFTINLYENEFLKAIAFGVVTPLTSDKDIYYWSSKYDPELGATHAAQEDCIL